MPIVLVVPVALITLLAVGAFALRDAEGHAAELREALFLLLVLAVVSASIGLMTLRPGDSSGDVLHRTAGSVSA